MLRCCEGAVASGPSSAVHRFTCFLDWSLPGRGDPAKEPDSDESDEEEEEDQDEPIQTPPQGTDPSEEPFARGYRITKTPSYPSLTIADVVDKHKAVDFVVCLSQYLAKLAAGNPQRLDVVSRPLHDRVRLSAYKNIKKKLPIIRQVSSQQGFDTIHASSARPANYTKGISAAPARMDTVLVRELPDDQNGAARASDSLRRKPLEGLRIARIRVIFNIPNVYDAKALGIADPLAYVEWFTPFHVVDEATAAQCGYIKSVYYGVSGGHDFSVVCNLISE
ncbi:hypothetical protein VTO73DRAFT_10681 [Trametes versicolor]